MAYWAASMTALIDENAFGLLLSWLTIEDDEYSLEPEEFLSRAATFRALVRARLSEVELGPTRALDLGHCVYLEVADGEYKTEPLSWLRGTKASLESAEFAVVAVLSYGGRWVSELGPNSEFDAPFLAFSGPSEPLRRALLCEAGAHGSERAGDGWGAGLFLDTEALEALGKKLKNAPTELERGGATFFRFGA